MGLDVFGAGAGTVTGSGTLNQVPLWVGSSTLGDSVLRQAGSAIIVGATDPAAAAAETFRTVDGIISDTGAGDRNTVIGEGAAAVSAAAQQSIVIGYLASSFGALGTDNVVIGANATSATAGAGQGSSVVIGANIQWTSTGGPAVLIGQGILASFPGVGIGSGLTAGGSGVAIGNQGSQSANNTVGIGRSFKTLAQYQTVLGDNAQGAAGHTAAIVIGANAASRGANTLTIGAANVGISDVLIGEGLLSSGAAPGLTWRYTGSQGTDVAGGQILAIASLGTGAAVGNGFRWQVGRKGASGFIGQTATDALELEGGSLNLGVIGAGAIGDYADMEGGLYIGTAFVAPTTNPVSGFLLYVNPGTGNLEARGPAGTVTTLAVP